MHCAECGFENPGNAKFCGGCGTPLKVGRPQKPEAERRQLTVLFCDLVGSTALSDRLDPEDLRAVVREYQSACVEVIERYEGRVAQYLGDGVLVYFGHPIAHEDDARRSVHAGLEIVKAVGALGDRLDIDDVRLAVRVGIHTGLVVAGEVGSGERREQLALGQTPNVAARLQSQAEPDTVLLSANTHRLVAGFFELEPLGQRTLQGISGPISIYRAVAESGVRSRFEVAVMAGLTPLVAREPELALLQELLERAEDGRGQVVLLKGESGIGKSRLGQMLRDRVGDGAYRWLVCRCSPYHINSALNPLIELLTSLFGFQREDSPDDKLAKLVRWLEPIGMPSQQAIPLLADLLGLPPSSDYAPLDLSPPLKRQRSLETLVTLLAEMAETQPVVFVMEDLHWVDPSSLDFLDLLVARAPEARLLVLLTSRPSFAPRWNTQDHLSGIDLGRLPRDGVAMMIDHLTGGKGLPDELTDEIVSRTDGVPLFVEELTKMVMASGFLQEREASFELVGPLQRLDIPETLQDSLMARLDQLAAAKHVAQLGAVLGRSFGYEVLSAVAGEEGASLQSELAQLVAAQILYQQGVPPVATYVFKHALIQDAAYNSLLKATRKEYHGRIAEVLLDQFPDTVAPEPELLAHHYTEAGETEQAVTYWQKAGQVALQRSANLEAIQHLKKGLQLLESRPDTVQRQNQELMLQATLGPALSATQGFAAPEVERAYSRALELCQAMGEAPELFWVLWGLWAFYTVRADLSRALELGGQLLQLAEAQGDPALRMEARFALGSTEFFVAKFGQAADNLDQVLALDSRDRDRSYTFITGQDVSVTCRCFRALNLWQLGYPEQALDSANEAIGLAREIGHPFTLAGALTNTACLHQLRCEPARVEELAREAIAISQEKGFFWVAQNNVFLGWALAATGQFDSARATNSDEPGTQRIVQLLLTGANAVRDSGARISQTNALSMLVESYTRLGLHDEAYAALKEGLESVAATGERPWEAELHRLAGELALAAASGVPSEAEGAERAAEQGFARAVAIAGELGAKSLELRAATSLGRLWRTQGKVGEARGLVEPRYEWFSEGFDSPDLQEAKALLEAMT